MCSAAKGKSSSAVEPDFQRAYERLVARGFYDRLRFPSAGNGASLARVHVRAIHLETERSVVLAALGLKRYQVRSGRLPAALSDLVPDILPTIPMDYMDGKLIRYRLQPDGTPLLYSVGENGTDDGGSAEPADESQLGGASARNLWKRKDFVWPLPASEEELQAYRLKAAKE
jgi:hypothetical protein